MANHAETVSLAEQIRNKVPRVHRRFPLPSLASHDMVLNMRTIPLLALLALPALAQPRTAIIKVNADGSFSPQITNIRSGDTVRWEGLTRSDSIIPVSSSSYPSMCTARRPFDPR